jgi:hypothetical protein
MSKYIPIGNRIMDIGYLRDGKVIHRGEALALAVLVHSKGKRSPNEAKEIAEVTKVFKRKTRR